MPLALFPSFLLFCTISAITPGPANLCSLASAMAYGRVPALRQWRGIFIGYALVSLLVSVVVWGLGLTLNRYIGALAWVSAAYILWLAWNILHSSHDEQLQHREHCNFYTGLFVQLTNAKIIVFCAAALTTYALPYAHSYLDVLKIALLLPLFGGPIANLLWLFAGAGLQRFFQKYQKPVNVVMALSLVFCAVNIIWK
ncbi:MAG: LysE family transporter [Lachnospiraceae bacterium]|nr:LysE family transporter [Lachnospiraceae bacterium]